MAWYLGVAAGLLVGFLLFTCIFDALKLGPPERYEAKLENRKDGGGHEHVTGSRKSTH
jgi:hypothetical protein